MGLRSRVLDVWQRGRQRWQLRASPRRLRASQRPEAERISSSSSNEDFHQADIVSAKFGSKSKNIFGEVADAEDGNGDVAVRWWVGATKKLELVPAQKLTLEQPIAMALVADPAVLANQCGLPLPPLHTLNLEKMHPIHFFPEGGALEGVYFSRGLQRSGVVVYGSIFTQEEDGAYHTAPSSNDPWAVLGDPISLSPAHELGMFRGLVVKFDDKPRLGRGNEQSPALSAASSVSLLCTRFKCAQLQTVGRDDSKSKRWKELCFLEATSNNLVKDLGGGRTRTQSTALPSWLPTRPTFASSG